jgi:hypothetical protein
MQAFFDFNSKNVGSTFQASPIELRNKGKIIYNSLIFGKYKGINFPVIFKQTEGKKPTDILDTGYTSLFLISNKLKTVLEANHFTGWKIYPIKLYDKKENEIEGYFGKMEMKEFFYFGSKLVNSTFQAAPIKLKNESLTSIHNMSSGNLKG